MKEYYGTPYLHKGPFPIEQDPHRCGDFPFVPGFIGTHQYSCKGWCNQTPCERSKFFTNYPSDYYLQYQKQCPQKSVSKEGFCVPGNTELPIQQILLLLFVGALIYYYFN